MRKAYLKSTGRLFLKHIIRLLSISAIFVVTVSLISGLGDVEGDIKKSINSTYIESNVHDVTITTINVPGTEVNLVEQIEDQLNLYKEDYGLKDIERFYSFDMPDEDDKDYAYRVEFKDYSNQGANAKTDKLDFIEGNYPTGPNQVLVERQTKDINQKNYKIGDKIPNIKIYPFGYEELGGFEITDAEVVGIVKNPRLVTVTHEHSEFFGIETDHQYLNNVFYFDMQSFDSSSLVSYLPSLAITLANRNIFNSFSTAYNNKIDALVARLDTLVRTIIAELGIEIPEDIQVASIIPINLPYLDYGLWSLNMYAEKVGIIASIFIAFFILIAILVIYSTMSRLLDEERGSMAVLKTMGYSNAAIAARYVAFTLVAGIVGVAISVLPARIVSETILNAFAIQYVVKQINFPLVGTYFFLLSGAILVISTVLIAIKSVKAANQRPVELLTHKAPKVGKKILMERIKPLWSRLSFKIKSTWRNIFLFKGRLIMTILSIMASTIMVFASFSLLNCTLANKGMEALLVISLVLLGFSAALCALVIYNITNINISERTREIATLMVLGYRNNEVTGYVYREIYILTIIGALLGLPAGYGFMCYVFQTIDVPIVFNMESIQWWSYVVSPILTCIFAFLATRLLHMKIVKTDMNESLKVLE